MQTLRTKIMAAAGRDSSLPLGSTPAGSTYATKALHPSDTDIPVQIPDDKNKLTTFLAYQNKYVVRPPVGLTEGTTWDCDILISSDPVCPCVSLVAPSSGGVQWNKDTCPSSFSAAGDHQYYLNGMIPNAVLPNTDIHDWFWAKMAVLGYQSACVREIRCAYSGVTAELEAAALADQGTVLAAQYPLEFDEFSTQDTTGNYCWRPINQLAFNRIMLQSAAAGVPTAYSGRAKDGVYMPIKFSKRDLAFKRFDDTRYLHMDYDPATATYRTDRFSVMSSTSVANAILPVPDVAFAAGNPNGPGCLQPMTDNIGHMFWRALSGSASIILMVRTGYEVTVQPNSVFAPTQKLPIPVDDMAMHSVVMIAREMADAHPASFNSLGALLPIIANVAAEVLPKVLPMVGTVWREAKGLFGQTVSKEEKAEKEKKAEAKVEQKLDQKLQAAASQAVKQETKLHPSIAARRIQILRKNKK